MRCSTYCCSSLVRICAALNWFSDLRIGGGSRYRQCAGGINIEDLAFALMTPQETAEWKEGLLVLHDPVAA